MSDAFIAFVRHEDKVLMMQRADGVADFPGAWDGVYGIGDPEDIDAVTTRITECTGIPADALQHVRSGLARGLAFGVVVESDRRLPRRTWADGACVDPCS